MSRLDDLHAAMTAGGDGAELGFYRALADAELFVLLAVEAVGEVITPRVFDLADGPVLLAFDSEERLAGFSAGPQPYAALPGRVIAGQMAGQGLSLGLNLGSSAAAEMVLPPEALAWLVAMLDTQAPVAVTARVVGYQAHGVPGAVIAALRSAVPGAVRGYLAGVRYVGGGAGQMLALVGVDPAVEAKVARAVTEALAFSGVEAGALDVVFLAAGDAVLARMVAVFDAVVAEEPESVGPGMDPLRPPVLR